MCDLKRCSKCKQESPISEFRRDKSRKDGLNPQCKNCDRLYRVANLEAIKARENAFRMANAERIKERKHKYYENNIEKLREKRKRRYAENSEKIKANTKKYRLAHIEQDRASHRAYYQAHRDQLLEYLKEWRSNNRARIVFLDKRYRETHREEKRQYERNYYANNPHVEKAKKHRRRSRIKSGGKFTSQEFYSLCSSHGFKCLCCGSNDKLTPDHVIPLSLGGKNTIENIQPLCLKCNLKKGTKTTDYRHEGIIQPLLIK